MKFKGDVKRWAGVAAAGLYLVGLVSCGGGTQIDAFVPSRVIAFGDEASVIDDSASKGNGAKYLVNAVKYVDNTATTLVPVSPVTLDCGSNPTWVQYLASGYGMYFAECLPAGATTSKNLIKAKAAAKAGDVAQQVTDFLASGSFAGTDLVTVLAGANDVVAQYKLLQNQQIDKATALSAVNAAGTALASQVVRITDTGAKVLVSTLPDVGLTPFARTAGVDAAALTELTKEFNKGLGLRLEDVKNGGRAAGLVQGYDIVLSMYQNPGTFAFTNRDDAACNVDSPLPGCTALTLQSAAVNGAAWMWADDLHYGAAVHTQLGSSALNRARNNPF